MRTAPRVRCAWCGGIKSEGSEPTSHGICEICATAFKLSAQKALMAPKADRFRDCPHCYYRDLDSDGVSDGCMAPHARCIAPGRRSPWMY